EQVTVKIPKDSGTYVSTFGPRAKLFVEKADFGSGFEALNKEFGALGQNPKQAHLNVFEYYLHMAHARVHMCLRASGTERPLAQLDSELEHLQAAARKIPLFVAHVVVVRGYSHLFHGRIDEALRSF